MVTRPRVACYPAPTFEIFHSADGRACGGTRDGLHTAVVSHLSAVFTLCGVAAALVLHDPRTHRGSRGASSAWSHVRESRATLPPRSRYSIQPMAGRVVALEMGCTQPWYRIYRPSSHSVVLLPRSCCTTLAPTVVAAGHRLRGHSSASRVLPCPHVRDIPFSRWQGVWWHSRWAAHSRGIAFIGRLHTLWCCCRARAARPSHPPW